MQKIPANTPGGAVKDAPSLPPDPSSEQVLDVAVEETFPASDPTAVGASVDAARHEPAAAPPAPKRLPTTADWPWPRATE